ncbi:nickel-dependent hydrogenase large subunit [Magnetofaba australis]|uniref:Putative Ni,Fe-hydrogenase I large subunit n=1 Tax=Magnetofaba australis IT-1 TaxID=1434232 RepID=A0A1Y2KBW0_9PROT|nr:nickel-dependent hydrogenase large subunit [Magnetofaba australis]OSM07299.1 putative Ni,Fe-hydrogenase I large subunit [Magnetofaba australis IT-1]
MSFDGGLRITLHPNRSGPARAVIDSQRMVGASRMLVGKPVEQLLALLPKLFVVCGVAQSVAAARAVEGFRGVAPSPAMAAQRNRLVALESIKEHLWQILLQWPPLLGKQAQQATMAQAAKQYLKLSMLLRDGKSPMQPGAEGDIANLDAAAWTPLLGILRETVFGVELEEWLTFHHLQKIVHWNDAVETLGAAMASAALHIAPSGWGQSGVGPLPTLSAQELAPLMSDSDFIARPRWRGACYESSALTRTRSALLEEASRYGNDQLTRVLARLTEMAQLALALRDGDDARLQALTPDVGAQPQGYGVGVVEAARGRLAHRVKLDGEVSLDYAILAPTEWNFHPDGAAAQTLASLRGDAESLQRWATLAIYAIDPCVGFELKVAPDA